ncbi:MAG: hypothetical protein WCG87_09155 [Bacteroidota bacterium]
MKNFLCSLFAICFLGILTLNAQDRSELSARLSKISQQMFDEGNEKYIIVDALKDRLIALDKQFSIEYIHNKLTIDPRLDLNVRQGSEVPEETKNELTEMQDQAPIVPMSDELREKYISKLQLFLQQQGEQPNTIFIIQNKYRGAASVTTIADILNPHSAFRTLNAHDRYIAGIETVARNKVIRHMREDQLIAADQKEFMVSYSNTAIVVDHKELKGEMELKYKHFLTEMGVDLSYDTFTGNWKIPAFKQ